ncbi:RNAse P rpr2/Rpp21/SNM1 subunit domain-containing protein [Ditylenchus destructor]|nr:RNAse P rpr2/Rpp21/SNM1 subunit domain-containing protein [Ditylenchus destructor]
MRARESTFRLTFLEQAALILAQQSVSKDDILSHLSKIYLKDLQEISYAEQIQLSTDFKRNICKKCFRIWTTTCGRQPVISMRKGRKKVYRKCLDCGETTGFVANANNNSVKIVIVGTSPIRAVGNIVGLGEGNGVLVSMINNPLHADLMAAGTSFGGPYATRPPSLPTQGHSLPGIVHQFESQDCISAIPVKTKYNKRPMFQNNRPALIKCPCCRDSNSEILCASCASTFLRLNKVRESRHSLLIRKAEICQRIDAQLKEQINFESDFYKKQQSILELKSKIAEKKERIEKLRQRIGNVGLNTGKNKKNVVLLERKMLAHSDRIARTKIENDNLRSVLYKADENLGMCIFHATSSLVDIFPIKRMEKKPSGNTDAWSGQQKKIFFSIRDAIIVFDDFNRLGTELCANSSCTDLALESRQTLAALTYACQLTDSLSTILHCILPYRHLTSDLCLNIRWTDDLFATTLFKINYCIIRLCLEQRVPVESLNFQKPLANLFQLISVLRDQKRNRVNLAAFDPKLWMQIIDEFRKVKWEERRHDFTLDNVEEDWVNVDFASAKPHPI